MLEFLVSFFKLWQNPISDVLQRNVLDESIKRLTTNLSFAVRTLVSSTIFLEVFGNALFAEGAHAFVYCMRVTVDAFAEGALEVG